MFTTGIAILVYVAYGVFGGAGLCCLLFAWFGPFRPRQRIILTIVGLLLIALPIAAVLTP